MGRAPDKKAACIYRRDAGDYVLESNSYDEDRGWGPTLDIFSVPRDADDDRLGLAAFEALSKSGRLAPNSGGEEGKILSLAGARSYTQLVKTTDFLMLTWTGTRIVMSEAKRNPGGNGWPFTGSSVTTSDDAQGLGAAIRAAFDRLSPDDAPG